MQAIIAFGANLGNPEVTFNEAKRLLTSLGDIIASSALYETAPLVLPGEDASQAPRYLNAVILIETLLSPEDVLAGLLEIEVELGRNRQAEGKRWQARFADLDLIGMEDQQRNSPSLKLPHPEMQNRDFVLVPLLEVAPDWLHPVLKLNVRELLENLLESGKPQFIRKSKQSDMK